MSLKTFGIYEHGVIFGIYEQEETKAYFHKITDLELGVIFSGLEHFESFELHFPVVDKFGRLTINLGSYL